MSMPDVTGYLLDEALALLKAWDPTADVLTHETKSPKPSKDAYYDEMRVLKQVRTDAAIELTIALF